MLVRLQEFSWHKIQHLLQELILLVYLGGDRYCIGTVLDVVLILDYYHCNLIEWDLKHQKIGCEAVKSEQMFCIVIIFNYLFTEL